MYHTCMVAMENRTIRVQYKIRIWYRTLIPYSLNILNTVYIASLNILRGKFFEVEQCNVYDYHDHEGYKYTRFANKPTKLLLKHTPRAHCTCVHHPAQDIYVILQYYITYYTVCHKQCC